MRENEQWWPHFCEGVPVFYCILFGSVFPSRGYFPVFCTGKSNFAWYHSSLASPPTGGGGSLQQGLPGAALARALPDLLRCKFARVEFWLLWPPTPCCILLSLSRSTVSGKCLPHPRLCSPGWRTLRLPNLCKESHPERSLLYLPFQGMASPIMDFRHTVGLPSTLEPLNLMPAWSTVSNTFFL